MRTWVCYMEIQRSRGKEGNACSTNEGYLRFAPVDFGFHCGRGKVRYVRELFSFSSVFHEFLKRCCLNMSQLSKYGSTWSHSFVIFTLTFSILIFLTTCQLAFKTFTGLNPFPVSIAFSFWTAVLWLFKKDILFC